MGEFKTINESAQSEFKDRGSKFFAYSFEVSSKEAVADRLEEIKLEHPKARHVCYAYILNEDYRANDDGEPSGSAGLPILNQIKSAELNFVLVAVVRYFGGTKLGVAGLINAFKTAAKDVLNKSGSFLKEEKEHFEIHFGYEHMETVMSFIKQNNAVVLNQSFNESCILKVEIGKDDKITYHKYFKKHEIKAF